MMLQKILNLFRRKKPIPAKVNLIAWDKSDIERLRNNPEGAAYNKLCESGKLESHWGNNPFLQALPLPINTSPSEPDGAIYPFPSDGGPDWPSITSDSVDTSSNDQPSDSNSFDFGGGSGDGGGATGEY